MRCLDTREQKSPRFLVKEFPDIEIKPLTVGDYFSGRPLYSSEENKKKGWKNIIEGNLVEIKIGKDFGIHTEQLERFQDELYRMSCYRQQNPHVQLHAVWVHEEVRISATESKLTKIIAQLKGIIFKLLYRRRVEKLFYHLCFQYHVWGHSFDSPQKLIEFLKELDQPSQYKEFEPYLKRSHEEPTDLSRVLRVPKGVSSDVAIQLSECQSPADLEKVDALHKKDRSWTRLAEKIEVFLDKIGKFQQIWDRYAETGESP